MKTAIKGSEYLILPCPIFHLRDIEQLKLTESEPLNGMTITGVNGRLKIEEPGVIYYVK